MQALVLAAGNGSRLGSSRPKPLSRVGDRSLIAHQVAAFRASGIDEVVVVVGYGQEHIREELGHTAAYVTNERYGETGSLVSFLLARGAIAGPAVVCNADVLFDRRVLDAVLSEDGCALAYDSSSGQEEEHMKVATRGSRLLAMSKDMPAGLVAGENVGLLRLTQHALRDAFAAADAALRDGAVREFIAFALNSICGTHSFACVDVKGLPWIEVDFPEDLERARRIVWPAIAGLEAPQHVGKTAAA